MSNSIKCQLGGLLNQRNSPRCSRSRTAPSLALSERSPSGIEKTVGIKLGWKSGTTHRMRSPSPKARTSRRKSQKITRYSALDQQVEPCLAWLTRLSRATQSLIYMMSQMTVTCLSRVMTVAARWQSTQGCQRFRASANWPPVSICHTYAPVLS